MRQVLIGAGLMAGLLLVSGEAQAQGGGMPPIPNKKEIEKKIKEAFPKLIESAPEVEVKFDGICRIKYKQVPTDPKKIAETLGKELGAGKLPAGVDVNQYIGMFLPQITALLNAGLKDIGEFEALAPIKIKKKIPVGKYRIGLAFKGEKPVAFIIFDPEKDKKKRKLKKPVVIKLKTKSVDLQPAVKIELKEPKKKKKGKLAAYIYLTCLRFMGKSKKPLVVTGPKE